MERIRCNCPHLRSVRIKGMRSVNLQVLLGVLKDNMNLRTLRLVDDRLSDSERAQLARVLERRGVEFRLLAGFRTFVHKGTLFHVPVGPEPKGSLTMEVSAPE